ncbi:hypothetical protein [Georgenia sp. Z1491]|uniref:hypothetical protein n=1 Tax=Georgenia sp. Z1491 TaxID=3416707 RepID=UPI003CE976D3
MIVTSTAAKAPSAYRLSPSRPKAGPEHVVEPGLALDEQSEIDPSVGDHRRVAPMKSCSTIATKWRAAPVPMRGGLKLADSPPHYELPHNPGVSTRAALRSVARQHSLDRASDARHYARHLVRDGGNGARVGRWSR